LHPNRFEAAKAKPLRELPGFEVAGHLTTRRLTAEDA